MNTDKKSVLVSNFLWVFLGRGWGVLLALIYVPTLVQGLGKEVYGVYATLIVVLSYFQFLDFGFSRALEKYGAEAVGAGDARQLKKYFATAFWLQTGLGAASAGLIWAAAPVLISLLKISVEFQPEAVQALRLAAANLGLTLASGTPIGALRARQRFRLLNGISVLTQTLFAVLSIWAVVLNLGLRGVMWALLIRSLVEFVLVTSCSLSLLGGRLTFGFDREVFRRLFRFGGFLTLSGVMNPILTNIEKVMIGALLPISAMTSYMVPYRLLEQFRLLPESVSGALFPYLNALEGRKDQASIYQVNWRATELLAWALLPMFAVLWIAGDELLRLWVGPELAMSASSVMSLLAVGFFINMLAWNSVAVIQACGRPEWHVTLYVCETIFYLPLAYFLIRRLGTVGAAWAWVVRVVVDALLQWTLASRLTRSVRGILPPLRWKVAALAMLVILGGLSLRRQWISGLESLVLGAVIASLLVGLGWFLVLDASERSQLPRLWFWREVIGA